LLLLPLQLPLPPLPPPLQGNLLRMELGWQLCSNTHETHNTCTSYLLSLLA
jgi:hypothetical protein